MNQNRAMPLFKHDNKIYYDKDLILCLEKLGVKAGNILCVHSELFKFGTMLLPRDELLNAILQCFWAVLGKNGTLLMPTFTYSFCKNQIYDKRHSKSTMGVLTEFYRKQNGVFRTNEPIFSFAVAGFNQKDFANDYESCFGEGCVYDTLYKKGGKILLFGCYNAGYTFTHYVEEKAGVSYRYYKDFSGVLVDERGEKFTKTMRYFVRKLNENSTISLEKQIKALKDSQNFKEAAFAGSKIILLDAKRYCDVCVKMLKKDEQSLLLGDEK